MSKEEAYEKISKYVSCNMVKIRKTEIEAELNGIPSLNTMKEIQKEFNAKDIDIDTYAYTGCPTCGPTTEIEMTIYL